MLPKGHKVLTQGRKVLPKYDRKLFVFIMLGLGVAARNANSMGPQSSRFSTIGPF
jgi:hypothetical protein